MTTQLEKMQIIRVSLVIFAFIWKSAQKKYIINMTDRRKLKTHFLTQELEFFRKNVEKTSI